MRSACKMGISGADGRAESFRVSQPCGV
jgi:hypothetical protein